ncbi:MAG TPA: hypothetical protein VGS19_26730 [Streptosporangiaceae bacterium]|nr:hypothetical protein [Streptosporangiaceae bacterium]
MRESQGHEVTAADLRQGGPPAEPTRGSRLASGQVAAPGSWGPRRPWITEALVVAGFLAAGVAVTWPRAAYLTGTLPASNDQAQYVWNMWWIAHQLIHLGNPWSTTYLASPVGIPLGFDTTTPLLGVVMAPVTLAFGPSASYSLLCIVTPGLAGYAMYRLARLWLPGWAGPLAAGAFFGLAGMEAYQAWIHLHTAVGVAFLPLTMEAAVRLRRGATVRRGVVLGVVVGACMLVDQEFAVVAVVFAALVLVPWLIGNHAAAQLRAVAASAVTAAVIASPQLIAMLQEAADGSTSTTAGSYVAYAARLPGLFAPSPRLATYGMSGLASVYQTPVNFDGLPTFGIVLTLLAVFGLVVGWRRRGARLLGVLWLGCALLSLGPTLQVGSHNFVPLAIGHRAHRGSLLLPYTWLIHVPGLSLFREAERFTLVGLVGGALLAGLAVTWLRRHAWQTVIVVAVLGALEAGWSGLPGQPTMPTALPTVDRPIAADHSGSTVVDVPFGILGVPRRFGAVGSPLALVLATADGHPRAYSYGPLAVPTTVARMGRHAFYAGLVNVWAGQTVTAGQIAAAREDVRAMQPGWVLVWLPRWQALGRTKAQVYQYPEVFHYLTETGFHRDFQADGVVVYRL